MIHSNMDLLMFLILGMAIGGIVPLAFVVKGICRGIMISIKEFDELEERLTKVEAEVKSMKQTENDSKTVWTRDDLPYDAMGDYSDMPYIKPRELEPVHTGKESPDDWYRAEYGGHQ